MRGSAGSDAPARAVLLGDEGVGLGTVGELHVRAVPDEPATDAQVG